MWNEAPENFQPNDAGGVTLTITSPNLDAPLVVDGLNRVSAIPDDPKVTKSKVASGLTNFNKMRTTGGKLEFEVSDASTSMGTLSTLMNLEEPVAFTFTDPVTPELNASSNYCYFEKHPDIVRTEETNMSVWVLECTVLKAKTGGFSIVVTE
jgi:hypothetical protein